MSLRNTKLLALNQQIEEIIERVREMENLYADEIASVNPVYHKSALNLVHYLGFRSFNIDNIQDQLRNEGLPSLSNVEGHVMKSLLAINRILSFLLGNPVPEKRKGIISVKKSKKILNRNTKLLFGYKSRKRRTRIMVTLPGTAAEDYPFVSRLIGVGMNSARVNCAHDGPEAWEKMIANVRKAGMTQAKSCKVMMDLGGPKLRTGPIKPGPKIIHIKPEKDVTGKVTEPATIWIATPENPPPDDSKAIHIPVNENWFQQIKRGDIIQLIDTRDKKIKITAGGRKGNGRWGYCHTSAYVSTGTSLNLIGPDGNEKQTDQVGELQPIEQYLSVKIGDHLILHKEPLVGEPCLTDETGKITSPAFISCTLPEIFEDVKEGEPIFFDDGKIEGIIERNTGEQLEVKITYAKDTGGKLKADKGINLPESDLKLSGLTAKDREDLAFVTAHADAVNFSFVNTEDDVQELLDALDQYENRVGIILKIETQKGFKNLPRILLRAMQTYPIGVMIARGDLAIETGWKNFASIQEEILRICEAAHIPDVWATQVLESLAKKGVPTRAEITDAAMAQRAECVMLNKGYHIEKAVKMLDKILRRMQRFQKKKETVLPKLDNAEKLELSHSRFNIN